MPGINDLIASIMGQTQTALDAPAAPWQQELLETVNPEKVKRQNIARALAQASTAMATTPGNFLAGVSAAASTGADAYLTSRDQAETERARVQQLVQMSEQKDQDRRLDLLMGALGVQRNQIQDQQSTERHKAGIERDKAYTDYYNRRGTGGSSGLSEAQIQTNKRSIRSELRWYEGQLRQQVTSGDVVPEDVPRLLEERKLELEDFYGVTSDESVETPSPQSSARPSPNVSQADLFAPRQSPAPGGEQVLTPEQYDPQPSGGITTGPGGIREGATATNRQTGERVIYRNGQWQPL